MADIRASTGTVADPALALRWLVRARRSVLALQVLLMILAEAGTSLHLHTPALLAFVIGWAAFDVAQALWLGRRPATRRAILVHACVDLAALTGILGLSGGPQNPLISAYLVYLALLAMVLPAVQAWAFAGIAMLLQALAVFRPVDVPGLAPEPFLPGHLLGHAVTFDVMAVAITWVVTRLSAALRDREAAELAAQRQRAMTDRLASLGTLAAGVAHELATPLGAIQLLAEESAGHPEVASESLRELVQQVARCSSIIDRLRGRDAPSASECVPHVDQWVTEWRRAVSDVQVEIGDHAGLSSVLGAEESWRAAVWVALDNARRAGASRVALEIATVDGATELRIDDDGRGLAPEAAERAGEPFCTGWGGTGLGLFVARTFAQSVGGDVVLEPSTHGARTRIRMPLA
jgi:two-component system sensor histidine kinase RegB